MLHQQGVLNSRYTQANETHIPVQDQAKNRLGYFWLYSDPTQQLVFVNYQKGVFKPWKYILWNFRISMEILSIPKSNQKPAKRKSVYDLIDRSMYPCSASDCSFL